MAALDVAARSKDVGRSVTHAWGQATAAHRMLPNVLIVGAQRCGTTALFRAILAHPAASGPVLRKGVHYFDMDYVRGMPWYQGWFPLRTSVARGAPPGQRPVVLEASPYYMFHPAVPGRIARDLPGVRAIVMLRDPVSRAHSAYKHEFARGFETLPFPEALAAEEGRLAGETDRLMADPAYVSHAHQHQAYLARGRYVEQLERLAAAIGRENVHVVDSARYFGTPDLVLAEVLRFLGLSPIAHGDVFRNESAGSNRIDPAVRTELRRTFAPHDEALAEWLGWTPSWMT